MIEVRAKVAYAILKGYYGHPDKKGKEISASALCLIRDEKLPSTYKHRGIPTKNRHVISREPSKILKANVCGQLLQVRIKASIADEFGAPITDFFNGEKELSNNGHLHIFKNGIVTTCIDEQLMYAKFFSAVFGKGEKIIAKSDEKGLPIFVATNRSVFAILEDRIYRHEVQASPNSARFDNAGAHCFLYYGEGPESKSLVFESGKGTPVKA